LLVAKKQILRFAFVDIQLCDILGIPVANPQVSIHVVDNTRYTVMTLQIPWPKFFFKGWQLPNWPKYFLLVWVQRSQFSRAF